jgi:hypothetical protein
VAHYHGYRFSRARGALRSDYHERHPTRLERPCGFQIRVARTFKRKWPIIINRGMDPNDNFRE